MRFLRPASPAPLQLPSSSMEGLGSSSSSGGDYMIGSPINPSPNPNLQPNYNPLSRLLQSPTPPNLKNKLRRPSQLSMAFDRPRPLHNSSSSSSSSATGVGMTSPMSNMGVGPSTPNANAHTIASILQAAPVIYSGGEDEVRVGRGRASSSASSMSFGFSPNQRSISLEGNSRNEGMADDMNENEETPNARRSLRLAQSSIIRRRMIGIHGPNESEGSLSNHSNGRHTPDLVGPKALEDEVDALVMDMSSSVKSSPMKDGLPVTPPNSAITLDEPEPFTIKGPLKPARLLRLQKELTAPVLDEETRSEAAFARLVQNSSDLASRLRLTISTSTPSPARKRQQRNWMANWSAGGANESRNWAGRYPESVTAEEDGETTDSNSDEGEPNTTLTLSRPPSGMGTAPMAMPTSSQSTGGRSRSGSTIGMDSMMLSTSYGATSEGVDSMGLNGGMMDLDMASNMSSPVSTPNTNNWREPFFPSKKRKFSAAVDAERFDTQPNMKKRKALSPHGHPIAIAANNSTLNASGPGSFIFPLPKSSTPNSLSMTTLTSSGSGTGNGNGNSSSSSSQNGSMYGGFNNWNNMYGAGGGGVSSLGLGMSLGVGVSTGTPMGMGLAGLTAGMSPGGNHNHHHRRSGSMSTMAWSRPGSAHSSPLLRPSSGNGGANSSIPAMSMLLGPSMLSNSTTANEDGNGYTFASSDSSAGANSNVGNVGHRLEANSGVRTLGGSSPGMGAISLPGFTYPNGVPIGQFGGPLTDSPSSRPMMRLPERAIAAMNAGHNNNSSNTNTNINPNPNANANVNATAAATINANNMNVNQRDTRRHGPSSNVKDSIGLSLTG